MPAPIVPIADLDADVLVVGGGISGLTAATLLSDARHRVVLLEARLETGGRIRSVRASGTGQYLGDLGPTWVWPTYQPTISRWLDRLVLQSMPQFDKGLAIAELSRDTSPMRTHLPGQDGSVRIIGGPQAVVDGLAAKLPTDAVRTNAQVTGIAIEPDRVVVTVGGTSTSDQRTFSAGRLVVSVPPRIAIETIDWQPALPRDLRAALARLATWMASHAKVVALYETAFWREQGLSGRIMSRVGPLVEAHDHSGRNGTPAALFGFVGWPRDVRVKLGDALTDHVVEQLVRCFGPGAAAPIDIQIKDWAADPLVCRMADLNDLGGHPHIGPELVRQLHFDGKACFAAAETAAQSPGLIEGGFIAGEHAAKLFGPQKR